METPQPETSEQSEQLEQLMSKVAIANYLWKKIPNRLELDRQKEYWFKRGVLDALDSGIKPKGE